MLPKLSALRDQDPLFWSEKSHCWIVTGHAEVIEGFSGTLPLLNGKMEAVLARVMPSDELHRRYPNSLRYMPEDLAEHGRPAARTVAQVLCEGIQPQDRRGPAAVCP